MEDSLPATSRSSPVEAAATSTRRKRDAVTEQSRKRVARACEACRRLKEKCDSVQPCSRCVRIGRPCTFGDAVNAPRTVLSVGLQDRDGGFFDAERIRILERIVEHFTGISSFGKPNLIRLAESLRQPSESQGQQNDKSAAESRDSGNEDEASHPEDIPSGGASGYFMAVRSCLVEFVLLIGPAYLGELSHSDFSLRLQQKVESRLHRHIPSGQINHVADSSVSPAATQIQSNTSLVVADAVKLFPPADIAYFLLNAFIEYAQTNYSYVDEQFLRDKLQAFYTSSMDLGNGDVSWICTVLMIFAIGTQFAHLSIRDGEELQDQDPTCPESTSETADDQLALTFYHQASKLIPDVIAIASIESVQAFLLLAVYTLPIDAAGLSCVFLGIAIRIATQNGMHRNFTKGLEPKQVELRRRLWWTAYTLERRVCILHGRPLSISRSDVDCEIPSGSLEFRTSPSSDVMPNVLTMIKLTDMLETAKDKIIDFRRAPRKLRDAKIKLIELHKKELQNYWESLPDQTYCRDLDPTKPLFRFNLHLALTFHLIRIFIGRSFILDSQPSQVSASPCNTQSIECEKVREELVSDCIRSAIEVVNLCQILHDGVGLARASYTEFTSCCAALLVVLARRISAGTTALQIVCDKGVKLLKKMSLGIYSNSDKATVEALETAIHQLQAESQPTGGTLDNGKRRNYAQFRSWAALQQPRSMADLLPGSAQRSFLVSPGQNATFIPDSGIPGGTAFGIGTDYEPFDLSGFVSVPGLDEIIRYGLQ